MRPTIVGIDPSSKKLAATVLSEHDSSYMETRKLPTDKVRRLVLVHEWVKALVEPYSDPWVFIEAPIVWGSKASTLLLGQVSGALIAAAGVAGAERVEMVNSSTWKKQVVGNGAAKKPEIARFVHQHWPKAWDMSNSDPDLMDSACIVQYGLQMWNRKLHVEELHQRDEQQTTGHRRMATPVRRPLRRITRP